MSYEINPTKTFLRGAKVLKKRYHSFDTDLEDFKKSLQANPFQGAELSPGIHGRIALLTIYDKQDAATVDLRIIKQMAKELGFGE